MSASGQLQGGQLFGRYQIVRVIGEGGMGIVYEAMHPGLKKRFAIKTLLPAAARKEEARVRFLREGEAASHIDHPNVVAVTDVGIEEGIPYLVMELLEGQTLAELLRSQRLLSAERAVGLLLPVVSAVAAGHESGVIHRDLKPENIFLAQGRRGETVPKVLDFGVSKFTADDEAAAITQTMTVLGTAAYMSPEQARGAKRVDFQSDQYALGLILYEMVTGRRAYPGENSLEILHKVASGAIQPAREVKPDLPDELNAVLTRMLAPSPTHRYPSLHECGHALLRLADHHTRLALTDEFRVSAPGAAVAAEPAITVRATEGRTSAAASHSALDTTLRHAAAEAASTAETPVRAGRPKGGGRRVAILGAAVLGAVAIVGVKLGKTTSASSASSASPASPASDHQAPLQRAAIGAAPTSVKPPAPGTSPATTVPFEIRSEPADAQIALDDRPPMRGLLELVLPLAGSSHEIRVSAPGYVSKVVSFAGNERPPAEIRLEHVSAAARRPHPPETLKPPFRADKKVEKTEVSRPSPPPARARKSDCEPNYFLDAQGEKHFKPECFLNKTQ